MLHGYAMVLWNIHETQVRRYGTEIVEVYNRVHSLYTGYLDIIVFLVWEGGIQYYELGYSTIMNIHYNLFNFNFIGADFNLKY